MRWTGWAALLASAFSLGGCVYYGSMVHANYSRSSRPHASYYCYDCHGYRYFDPYYDYCVSYGYRYRWTDHPRVISLYRERYVRIRENHPDYGRYRYAPDYRASSRYREERRYENGTRTENASTRKGKRGSAAEEKREKRRGKAGTKDESRDKAPRKEGRFAPPPGGSI